MKRTVPAPAPLVPPHQATNSSTNSSSSISGSSNNRNSNSSNNSSRRSSMEAERNGANSHSKNGGRLQSPTPSTPSTATTTSTAMMTATSHAATSHAATAPRDRLSARPARSQGSPRAATASPPPLPSPHSAANTKSSKSSSSSNPSSRSGSRTSSPVPAAATSELAPMQAAERERAPSSSTTNHTKNNAGSMKPASPGNEASAGSWSIGIRTNPARRKAPAPQATAATSDSDDSVASVQHHHHHHDHHDGALSSVAKPADMLDVAPAGVVSPRPADVHDSASSALAFVNWALASLESHRATEQHLATQSSAGESSTGAGLPLLQAKLRALVAARTDVYVSLRTAAENASQRVAVACARPETVGRLLDVILSDLKSPQTTSPLKMAIIRVIAWLLHHTTTVASIPNALLLAAVEDLCALARATMNDSAAPVIEPSNANVPALVMWALASVNLPEPVDQDVAWKVGELIVLMLSVKAPPSLHRAALDALDRWISYARSWSCDHWLGPILELAVNSDRIQSPDKAISRKAAEVEAHAVRILRRAAEQLESQPQSYRTVVAVQFLAPCNRLLILPKQTFAASKRQLASPAAPDPELKASSSAAAAAAAATDTQASYPTSYDYIRLFIRLQGIRAVRSNDLLELLQLLFFHPEPSVVAESYQIWRSLPRSFAMVGEAPAPKSISVMLTPLTVSREMSSTRLMLMLRSWWYTLLSLHTIAAATRTSDAPDPSPTVLEATLEGLASPHPLAYVFALSATCQLDARQFILCALARLVATPRYTHAHLSAGGQNAHSIADQLAHYEAALAPSAATTTTLLESSAAHHIALEAVPPLVQPLRLTSLPEALFPWRQLTASDWPPLFQWLAGCISWIDADFRPTKPGLAPATSAEVWFCIFDCLCERAGLLLVAESQAPATSKPQAAALSCGRALTVSLLHLLPAIHSPSLLLAAAQSLQRHLPPHIWIASLPLRALPRSGLRAVSDLDEDDTSVDLYNQNAQAAHDRSTRHPHASTISSGGGGSSASTTTISAGEHDIDATLASSAASTWSPVVAMLPSCHVAQVLLSTAAPGLAKHSYDAMARIISHALLTSIEFQERSLPFALAAQLMRLLRDAAAHPSVSGVLLLGIWVAIASPLADLVSSHSDLVVVAESGLVEAMEPSVPSTNEHDQDTVSSGPVDATHVLQSLMSTLAFPLRAAVEVKAQPVQLPADLIASWDRLFAAVHGAVLLKLPRHGTLAILGTCSRIGDAMKRREVIMEAEQRSATRERRKNGKGDDEDDADDDEEGNEQAIHRDPPSLMADCFAPVHLAANAVQTMLAASAGASNTRNGNGARGTVTPSTSPLPPVLLQTVTSVLHAAVPFLMQHPASATSYGMKLTAMDLAADGEHVYEPSPSASVSALIESITTTLTGIQSFSALATISEALIPGLVSFFLKVNTRSSGSNYIGVFHACFDTLRRRQDSQAPLGERWNSQALGSLEVSLCALLASSHDVLLNLVVKFWAQSFATYTSSLRYPARLLELLRQVSESIFMVIPPPFAAVVATRQLSQDAIPTPTTTTTTTTTTSKTTAQPAAETDAAALNSDNDLGEVLLVQHQHGGQSQESQLPDAPASALELAVQRARAPRDRWLPDPSPVKVGSRSGTRGQALALAVSTAMPPSVGAFSHFASKSPDASRLSIKRKSDVAFEPQAAGVASASASTKFVRITTPPADALSNLTGLTERQKDRLRAPSAVPVTYTGVDATSQDVSEAAAMLLAASQPLLNESESENIPESDDEASPEDAADAAPLDASNLPLIPAAFVRRTSSQEGLAALVALSSTMAPASSSSGSALAQPMSVFDQETESYSSGSPSTLAVEMQTRVDDHHGQISEAAIATSPSVPARVELDDRSKLILPAEPAAAALPPPPPPPALPETNVGANPAPAPRVKRVCIREELNVIHQLPISSDSDSSSEDEDLLPTTADDVDDLVSLGLPPLAAARLPQRLDTRQQMRAEQVPSLKMYHGSTGYQPLFMPVDTSMGASRGGLLATPSRRARLSFLSSPPPQSSSSQRGLLPGSPLALSSSSSSSTPSTAAMSDAQKLESGARLWSSLAADPVSTAPKLSDTDALIALAATTASLRAELKDCTMPLIETLGLAAIRATPGKRQVLQSGGLKTIAELLDAYPSDDQLNQLRLAASWERMVEALGIIATIWRATHHKARTSASTSADQKPAVAGPAVSAPSADGAALEPVAVGLHLSQLESMDALVHRMTRDEAQTLRDRTLLLLEHLDARLKQG
ncbi:hypothetical protein CAOG_00024 [Capsaspora owczarzaki ATCC 30864]|uniref:Telomere-associated protein Rif1 N-terminal domain-containing protein n=1 Tax=Capsaspora owczarzaki (strain ATCC 30864) TaxID=595528 RepID=A0A0D2VF69_CAPO3|nr:hypothetical protein CAOG_00024 [Capsaspora owczarzaki ATCC 30864]KJE88362.1 hypothetical protein CAOG_000024 [Capsaspora owczarzaki ATCC 30864]|eukprot:XP_004364895.2 hypothetical protein CAOG_00024 [Capsaspora owczarzaki ATCC 30864]